MEEGEYEVEIEGLSIRVCQGVYPPSEDTFLLLDEVGRRRASIVLEVGSGTGLIALKQASLGAYVVALDIDSRAAKCTKLNSQKNQLRCFMDVVLGDLTSPFRNNCFDLIAFNPPYLPVEDGDRRWAGGPNGKSLSNKFIEEAPLKVKEGGPILLIQSTLSGVDDSVAKLNNKGLKTRVLQKLRTGLFEELALIEATKLDFKQSFSKASSKEGGLSTS